MGFELTTLRDLAGRSDLYCNNHFEEETLFRYSQ